MRVLIGGEDFILDVPFASKGEGEVYKLDFQSAVKVYHKRLLDDPLLGQQRRLKVLAFCNSYANNVGALGTDSFGFPRVAAYENREELRFLCGFAMQFFDNCPELAEIGFDLRSIRDFKNSKSVKLDDDLAVQFIYNTFEIVDRLHKARVILGDINPSNILYNRATNYPIIIDLDSAQIGQYRCLSWSDEYLDPLIQQQGKNMRGGYTYSYESDNFSIACVCFEFLIGVNPFFIFTDPPPPPPHDRVIYNKEHGISILSFLQANTSVLGSTRYLVNPVNENIKSRINSIKSKHPKLYDYFISIFLDSNRISLMQTLGRLDSRHPAHKFYSVYSQSGFDITLIDILTKRRRSIPTQPLPTAPTVFGSFTIPDSGFSKVVPGSSAVRTTPIPPSVSQVKSQDPDQLLLFLKSYSVDTTNLIVVV